MFHQTRVKTICVIMVSGFTFWGADAITFAVDDAADLREIAVSACHILNGR